MPDPESIGSLKRLLGAAMEPRRIFHSPVWGDPQAMSKVLRGMRSELGSVNEGRPATDVLQRALLSFSQTKSITNFNDLKYVCYGVTVPVLEGGWRVIDQPPLFNLVLELVDAREAQPKQFRRCYQGLLNAYFCFDKQGQQTPKGPGNWTKLGGFLDERLIGVRKAARRRGEPPEWLELLNRNRNLLGAEPCAPYARSLIAGDQGPLRAICEGLGIPDSSWVWNEALLAYVALLCQGSDRAYRDGLEAVLSLINGRSQLRMPEGVARQATAMTTVRYSRCTDRSEHLELRDTAVRRVGSPWLERAAWDAHVGDEPARQLVEGWLKRRLIKDFFELLAQDGGADVRRLNYWLKWEPQITDMWFVLGADARRNPTAPFKALRERMEGRSRALNEPDGSNNAFVMRIGPLLIIEFGQTGNACYAFAASDFKTDLDSKAFTLNGVNPLKQKLKANRFSHMASWESKFDFELALLLRHTPASKGQLPGPATAPRTSEPAEQPLPISPVSNKGGAQTAPTAPTALKLLRSAKLSTFNAMQIMSYCKAAGVAFEDKRDRDGGSFWVYVTDRTAYRALARNLEDQGFLYAPSKGYWLRDEA